MAPNEASVNVTYKASITEYKGKFRAVVEIIVDGQYDSCAVHNLEFADKDACLKFSERMAELLNKEPDGLPTMERWED